MATEYLEKYIESVADLPAQLQRKFRLIRDLDEKSARLQADISTKCRKQLNAAAAAAAAGGSGKAAGPKRPRVSGAGADADAALVADITQGQAQLLSWAEEKMHIAFQVYDLVDKHIRELDEDLKAFASEVDSEALALGLDAYETACGRLGIENGPALAAAARAAAAAARGGGGGGASGGGDGGGRGGGGRQKRKAAGGRGRKGAEADAAAGLAGVPPPDVAADASQPRYCLCQNVSYGDMVACDNIECPIEWFHFACVGLTEQPKGKWYCPECAPQFQAAQQKHGGGAAAAHAAAAGAAAGGGGGGKKGGRR